VPCKTSFCVFQENVSFAEELAEKMGKMRRLCVGFFDWVVGVLIGSYGMEGWRDGWVMQWID